MKIKHLILLMSVTLCCNKLAFASSQYITPPFYNLPVSTEITVDYQLNANHQTLVCKVNKVNDVIYGQYWKNKSTQIMGQFDENIPLTLTINPSDEIDTAVSEGELRIFNTTRRSAAKISCEYKL